MSLIALIDDDLDILEASTLILEANGYEVITANNPITGFEIVKEKSPDLIILDVMMDEADDGFFLAQKFRKEGIKTPILMYTSISKTIGLQFGANDLVPVDDFVEKPISPEELIKKVKKLLWQIIGETKMLIQEKTSLAQEIEELVNKYGNDRSALIKILNEVQKKHRYISDYAQQEIARHLNIHPVEVYSVISFYSFLNSTPKGRNIVRICKTVSCEMKGKENIVKAIERELNIKIGDTTEDNKFTVEYANCLGLCDVAPAMSINDRVYTKLTPEKAVQLLNEVK